MHPRKQIDIGQTKTNLLTRLKQESPNCSPKQEADVTKRLMEKYDHSINVNNVVILAQSDRWRKLSIKKTLPIQSTNCRNIDVDQSSSPSHYVYCQVLFDVNVVVVIVSKCLI